MSKISLKLSHAHSFAYGCFVHHSDTCCVTHAETMAPVATTGDALMTAWPTGLNHSSGPLWKKLANPRSNGMVKGRGINAVASKSKIFLCTWAQASNSV